METFPGVGVSTDSADKDIMKRNPSKLSEPIISRKQRVIMIVDGIVFGLSIAAGYILSFHYMLESWCDRRASGDYGWDSVLCDNIALTTDLCVYLARGESS